MFSQFDFEKHGFTEPSKDTYSVIAEYVDGSTEALCSHKAFAEPDRYLPVVFGHVPAWHFSYLPYTWRVWVVYDPHQSIVGLWYFVREATFPYGQGADMHVLRQDRHAYEEAAAWVAAMGGDPRIARFDLPDAVKALLP